MRQTLNIALVSAALAASAGLAHAQPVQSFATGADLAGGTLEITWGDPGGGVVGVTSAPIVAFSATGGAANVAAPFGAGSALFSVDGDTFLSDWRLANGSQFVIFSANFDLHGSRSLFDNNLERGAFGGTPNSALGRAGVDYLLGLSTAPMELGAAEHDSWADPSNVGDMFWQEEIRWNRTPTGARLFMPGDVYAWRDDTDIIPAPASLALLGLGLATAARRRRQA